MLGSIDIFAPNFRKLNNLQVSNHRKSNGFLTSIFGKSAPAYAKGGSYHSLKKGADIKLAGEADETLLDVNVTRFALQPHLYGLMSPIPKVNFAIGDEVKAGDALFYDKKRPEIQYASPVSGEVVELIRGPKRAIHQIVILADKENKYKSWNVPSDSASREDLVAFMAKTGAWATINQRPFDIVPHLDSKPKNIFISTFDSSPLAPNLNFVVNGKEAYFQKGLDVLGRLTEGKVYLGLDADGINEPNKAFTQAEGVEKHWFSGKHPAGNVGIQIHHINPIKAGENVWTLDVQAVISLGKLFTDGVFDQSRTVAITGHALSTHGYVNTYLGANVSELLASNKLQENSRLIAGNVLSGRIGEEHFYLGHKDTHITAISEGNQYELFGWLLPLKPRPSLSNTFPNFLFPNHKFEVNTNTHGEGRAIVVSGQYEEVLPMNIYPMHLVKAILANDFERMEGLGIYELTEEDVALCEFACTSKTPVQQILRQGLNTMLEQQ